MSEWQPIETAPKDGTELFLWCGLEAMPGCWYEERGWHIGLTSNNEIITITIKVVPTHWMPLPDAPKEEK